MLFKSLIIQVLLLLTRTPILPRRKPLQLHQTLPLLLQRIQQQQYRRRLHPPRRARPVQQFLQVMPFSQFITNIKIKKTPSRCFNLGTVTTKTSTSNFQYI